MICTARITSYGDPNTMGLQASLTSYRIVMTRNVCWADVAVKYVPVALESGLGLDYPMINDNLPYHRFPRLTSTGNTRSALPLRACTPPAILAAGGLAKRSPNIRLSVGTQPSRFPHKLGLAAPIDLHLHMAELGFPTPRTRRHFPPPRTSSV
jgi:hypothetical protein